MPVTEAFYEAAIVPELWKEALNRAGEAWNADGVIVSSYPDCLSGYLSSDRMEEFCDRFVSEGWYKRDVRAVRGLAFVRKGNEIATDLDLFTLDELKQLPFYTDFLEPLGFQWFAGTMLTEVGASQITLSVHRNAGRDPFLQNDLSRIQRDLPHVKRAARLASKARMSYAEGLVDSLEHLTCCAILIDWLGRVIRMNKKAEGFVGKHFQVISSRLRAQHRDNNKALQELVEICTRPVTERRRESGTSALLQRSNELPLVVHAYPIVRRASDVFQGAAGLLLLNDPGEERGLDTRTIQKMFQLTPSEIRVSTGLAKGLDTQQIANEHGIGADTVRYHLKSIFGKTSTRHQAQLVSLLSRLSDPPELN
jgi:DNA-binding CsgD family transcriptional regulator